MRNTHTSKQTSKCSTHINRRFFDTFSTSINKLFLEPQIIEYKKKLSTTQNAYDTPQDNRNTTPNAPQLHNLHINHPLS